MAKNNTVIDDFNNWIPEEDDKIVCIAAAKWDDDEFLLTHTFKSEGEGLNLNKLLAVEIFQNWYDNTHDCASRKHKKTTEERKEDYDKILKLIDKMLTKIIRM